jgi:histidinol phosphatase-like PHP family hydrolase
MKHVYYDLHIHSALSPCADDDMTPNDIVSMALLNKLDVIALTDHNSFANVESVQKAALDSGLIVLPGCEVETAEEVHVLCLFSDMVKAAAFEEKLSMFYSNAKNRADIFGRQIIYDENDNEIGEMERMLMAACAISFDELFLMVMSFGGAFIPAHIDRQSNSVISNLGFIPPHINVGTVEISSRGIAGGFLENNQKHTGGRKVVISSDAHQLWTIAEREHFIKLREKSAESVIEYLRE